ncbi:acetate--CoA ligase family protein [Nanoarchaeota archaeon]
MKNLNHIFNPKRVAIIGASRDKNSVGYGVLKSLKEGGVFKTKFSKGYKGKIYAVNPNAKEILGIKSYKSVLNIKGKVDLAVICVPAKIVYSVVKECAKKKVKGLIIISAGFAELGINGKVLQDNIVEIAQKNKMHIVGPNCLGIIRTKNHLNTSFAPTMPPEGNVAFITQSGALADSAIDWAVQVNYGFSTIISYGNHADLDIHDFIDYLSKDKETNVIAIYMEGLVDGKKFMESVKNCKKPIVVMKAGKTEDATKAISSHTGSLAGSYEIYKTAFKQSGIYEADSMTDLFGSAWALANLPKCENNIAIVTNGGGAGVLCADACNKYGVNLVKLNENTVRKLFKTGKMHHAFSRRNPLDIVGDALPERYSAAIDVLLKEKYVDGLIVIQTLQTMTDPLKNAKIIVEARKKYPKKPIICCFLGGKFTQESIDYLNSYKVPTYIDPDFAAKAMSGLVK